ncbi:MAG: alpha/beta hydrolase [Magnetococcales bacterium]|nr:alpha/beta hydrolase [Magnetococcales bacterium]
MNRLRPVAGTSWVPAIFWALMGLLGGGCASRHELAQEIAAAGGLRPEAVATARFDLLAFTRLTPDAPRLTVYLEGDGDAWITPTRLSDDPTPRQPVALRLAARDPSPSVAYLARPCQYVQGTARHHCHPAFWSHARYAPEVVDAFAEAIGGLMARSGATRLHLVGYSGGGALALLLAQRGVVPEQLTTVAGLLDTAAWSAHHRLSPLTGSLNPADGLASLGSIPQTHWVGGRDEVVPPALTRAALARAALDRLPTIRVREIPGYDHDCCWEATWPEGASPETPANGMGESP